VAFAIFFFSVLILVRKPINAKIDPASIFGEGKIVLI
jgi:hypothetical protein